MLTVNQVKFRKVIREEIKRNHSYLTIREQHELEEQMFQRFKAALAGAGRAAGSVAKGAAGAVSGAAGAVGGAASNVAKKVSGVAQNANQAVKNIANQITGKTQALAQTTFDKIGDITQGLADSYSSGQADSLRQQAKKLMALAKELEAQANQLSPQAEVSEAKMKQITESVILKLHHLGYIR